ncbi:MAG: radical SAM family heme chaperone HemW [Chitinispirillaceae bacterium]|nr:radical SAM family heme chaperone HemW [Chitinispirillaceae bacterium]
MPPLSLYLHIPFCAKKCRYCDFYSVKTDACLIQRYVAALSREIDLYRDCLAVAGAQVRTVYFGGGTPTVLPVDDLARLCDLVRSRFSLMPDIEWTVECNPDSFSSEKASVLLDYGVTRLTIGVQSLDDHELSLLGRTHSAERCLEVLHDAVLERFASIGIDLIYGLPGQTREVLNRTVSRLLSFPVVAHVSAYELTVAEKTPFGRHRSLLPLPDEDSMACLARLVWKRLVDAGFEQYEVSNFARRGFRCRHNQAYWDHNPFLGLGCAAHSYLPPDRWGTVRDVQRYCTTVEAGERPYEFIETIDPEKLAAEMLFLGLRRSDGINENNFVEKSGYVFLEYIHRQKIEEFEKQGLLRYAKPYWRPSSKGMLMADAMARALIPDPVHNK